MLKIRENIYNMDANPMEMSLDEIIEREKTSALPKLILKQNNPPPLKLRSGSLGRNSCQVFYRGRTPNQTNSPPPLKLRSYSRPRSRSRSRTPGQFQTYNHISNQWNPYHAKGRQSRRDQYEYHYQNRFNYNKQNYGNWNRNQVHHRSRSRSCSRSNFNGYGPSYDGNFNRYRSRSRNNNNRNRSRSRSQSYNPIGNNREGRSCSMPRWQRSNSRQRMNFYGGASSIAMTIQNEGRNENNEPRTEIDVDALRYFAVSTNIPLGERFRAY